MIRSLHLYCGLFISPFVLLFASSVFYLNHGKSAAADLPQGTVPGLQVPAGAAIGGTSFAAPVVSLHKLPGPRNAAIGGSRIATTVWRLLTDATVLLLLFLSTSGVYLWWALGSARIVGLALVTAGAVTVFGLIYALTL